MRATRSVVARAVAALVVGLAAAGGGAQAQMAWPEGPYSQYADQQPLSQVLADFAHAFSLQLAPDPSLPPVLAQGVSGRFNAAGPAAFLDRLCATYGLQWYVRSGVLHLSRTSQQVSRALPLAGANAPGLKRALQDMGVLDPRFGWGELPEQGVVLVSGPPAYVAALEQTLSLLPRAPGGQQVEVFRLRHASVDDRSYQYRDRELLQPGLASVLRQLVGGQLAAPNEAVAALAAPLRDGTTTTAAPAAAGSPARAPAVRRPASIQADPRLNALIVQDSAERLPLYRQLIALLDQPAALVEIEALIIDVNANRLEELGVAWGARQGTVALGFGNPDQALESGTLAFASGSRAVVPGSVSLAAGNFLVSRIRALESKGEARIQSRPSILTVENSGALIDLSETFYIRTTGERVATVTPVTVGTTLRVTPRLVTRDDGARAVQLTVDIEDGAIQDRQVDRLPTVRRSNVSTQALVPEDATLLIGGYRTEQQVHSDERVPVLGSIPGLGALFSTRSQDVTQRERLFLIRPRMVTPLSAAAGAAAAEAATAAAPAMAPVVPASAPSQLPVPLPLEP